ALSTTMISQSCPARASRHGPIASTELYVTTMTEQRSMGFQEARIIIVALPVLRRAAHVDCGGRSELGDSGNFTSRRADRQAPCLRRPARILHGDLSRERAGCGRH